MIKNTFTTSEKGVSSVAVYLISYTLYNPGQDYAELHEEIKELGAWWHYLTSTWLVSTSLGSSEINNRLKPKIDKNDSLLVIRVTADYSGWLPEEAWDWLRQQLG